jgi:hypothetical protein
MQPYKVWWISQGNNFGDIITPEILKHYNINFFQEKNYTNSNLICVGSIIRRAVKNTLVLGSGILDSKREKLIPDADYKFVRGPYTRNKVLECGGNCPDIYGDPGLLLPKIYNPKRVVNYKIGYVPHMVDYSIISSKFENTINLCNPNYKEVIDQITQCELIVSSSLHGIITAHAYNIPAAWAKSVVGFKGDNVKFYDYFASLNIDPIESTFECPKYLFPKSINTTQIEEIFSTL